jgi:hypothetical protein
MKRTFFLLLLMVLVSSVVFIMGTKISSLYVSTLEADVGRTYVQCNTGFNIGESDTGYDATFFGATAGQYALWDASEDTWYFGADAEGVDVYFNANTTGDYALWDESDEQLELVGASVTITDGGITMDGILTGQRLTTEVVTGATDVLTESQSGSILIYAPTATETTVTLPDATKAGVYFIIVDANVTAAGDLIVDSPSGNTINGDTAGQYVKCEIDVLNTYAIFISTAADTWYVLYPDTAWTQE